MRQYIYSVMTDRRKGFLAAVMRVFLSAVSFFYGMGLNIKRAAALKAAKGLPCRVISVGNLTLGGTGKTPFACFLAKLLESEGRRPSVLIRGYGQDEWKMLKENLEGIPVMVNRDRVASGNEACQKLGADSVVLDDGFQHWRLKRDLDIVLIDSSDPFGNGRLFPRGILRERVADLKRSDVIVLTKTDMAKENAKEIKAQLGKTFPDIPVLLAVHKPMDFYDFATKEKRGLEAIRGADISALSSIVNTKYFEHTLESLGARIVSRFHYPDHHDYTRRDIDTLMNECAKANIGTIVTTEKDAVKLDAMRYALCSIRSLRLLVLRVQLKVTDGEEVLKERLRRLFVG